MMDSDRTVMRAIGSLEADVKSLLRLQEKESGIARDHRAKVSSELHAINATVAPLVRDVAEMKPVVERVERREHQAAGALWVARGLYAIAGAAIAVAGWAAAQWTGK